MSKKKTGNKTIAPKQEPKETKQHTASSKGKGEKKVHSVPLKELNKSGNTWMYWGICIAAISILTTFAYFPALDNDFVDWDDTTYVINNDLVRQKLKPTTIGDVFKTPVSLNYHPITILTMRWNDNKCPTCKEGISAAPFITWNLILHILNSILVFMLGFLLSKRNWFVAAFGAAVFAFHPMHVESVAWVSERKDVLYVFFFLLGLLSYHRYLDDIFKEGSTPSYKWLGLAFGCFLLACLSKAMAVVFPLVLILIHFWRYPTEKPLEALQKSFAPKRLLEYLPFFALALFFGMMAMSVQSGGDFNGLLQISEKSVAVNKFDTFTLLQRFQFAGYGFCMYIYKFFVPTALSTLHPYPTQAYYDSTQLYSLVLVGFILILLAAIFSMIKTKIIAFGIGFYFITVAFVLQFISVGTAIMADRYSYLPYFGIAFMLGVGIEKLPKQIRYVFYGLAIFASLIWIMQTRVQADTWQDSETLWATVIKHYPQAEQAYSILGNYYGKQTSAAKDTATQRKYMEKAEFNFRKAIENQSTRADVFEGLGNIESMKGNREQALLMYNRAIELNPGKATVYINRGVAHSLKGDYQSALQDMKKAVTLDPQPTHILYRGMAYEAVGDKEAAKADYLKVLQMTPNNVEAKKRMEALGG